MLDDPYANIPYHEIQDWCWHNKIFVIQKPTQKGYKKGGYPVKLIVDLNGKKKYGKLEYKQNSNELYKKIEELYRAYYGAYT